MSLTRRRLTTLIAAAALGASPLAAVAGPQTRSAMKWRLYHPAKRIWSTNCYSPL